MTTATVDEILKSLGSYLLKVKAGETVVIVEGEKAVAELKPVNENGLLRKQRPFGLAVGQMTIAEDFDAPLPEEIQKDFGEK